jgi:hypothetical protein
VIRQSLVAGSMLVLVAAVPAAAQRPAPPSDEQQLRNQLQKFEVVLQLAVRQGGDAFARQRKEAIPPGVQLTSEDPQVKGFAPPEGGGLFFYVSVPSIRIGINQLLLQVEGLAPRQQRPRTDPLQPAAGRSVNQDGPVSAQGLLTPPDPMTASPVVDEGTCAGRTKPSKGYSNPDYEYAVAVCDALMDAMLDSPGPLPIKENEWLTVAAVSGDPAPPGLISTSSDYVTYLQIKGSDLLAYRQGKITKEEARKLVEMKQR